MYYHRNAENIVREYLQLFPVIGVMGPRQSGKSTMLRKILTNEFEYVTFDDFEKRELLNNDPKKFISRYSGKVIFDEAQYVPALFPLIKQVVDIDRLNYGNFILTGSGQFLMGKHFSESLAGRIGLIQLMPMQLVEIPLSKQQTALYNGSYPELVVRNWSGNRAWYNSYVETYIQKDLRQMTNIADIHAFTTFLRYLAANVAQAVNLSEISRSIGVSVPTLNRWLSVLESSYIVFLLQPYYKNLGKRLVKSPKIYFTDTGLVSYLTGIEARQIAEGGVMAGQFFENFIVSEIQKHIFHSGSSARMFYYRTNHGDEIDIVLEQGSRTDLIEIKASKSYRPLFHKTIAKSDFGNGSKKVVFQGDTSEMLKDIKAVNFVDFLKGLSSDLT
jgi:predicted AAA+ superfamily ATPase